MIPVPKTEPGLTASVSEVKARKLIKGSTANRVDGPTSALVYSVGGTDIKFYPNGYTTVTGPEAKVLELIA